MDRQRRQMLRLAGVLTMSSSIPRWAWAAPARPGPPDLIGRTMGTSYRIRIDDDLPRRALPRIRAEIENALSDVNNRLSLYRPDSELSRLNGARAGLAMGASIDTLALVRSALEIRTLSGGAFSPFTEPLVRHWGFGPGSGNGAPMTKAAASPISDASLVLTDSAMAKPSANVALDLNGIAKGDAVDRVADILQRHGAGNCLVEIGGEVACAGRPSEGPWRVGIQGPDGNLVSRVTLDNAAVATSGDHIHYYLLNGRRYSHLMNPATGRPVDHDLALVSVVAPNARLADAWSTALMVLGPGAGHDMALKHQLAALFVRRLDRGWSISRTPAYDALEETA